MNAQSIFRSTRKTVVLSLVSCCLGASLSAVEIIAHRGASHDAPENSLSAMKLAWKQGSDGIETDIYLSKDDKIVVMHDADAKRTGGLARKVEEANWNELKDMDVGKWMGPQWEGEKLPTLDSIFATIQPGKYIFTEIKSRNLDILPVLEKTMKASDKKVKQLRFITFHYEVAKATKAYFPKHQVLWLSGYKQDKETGRFPDLDELIKKAKAAKLDGLDLQDKFPIDKAFVDKVHKAGLKLYTWTVDEPEVARTHVKAGVDGITTNRPEFLRQQLQQ